MRLQASRRTERAFLRRGGTCSDENAVGSNASYSPFVGLKYPEHIVCAQTQTQHNKKCLGQKSKTFFWVQGPDLNQRPPGYEPDELPDCSTLRYLIIYCIQNTIGAGDRNRTGTEFNLRRILSPVRLPVPPLRRTYRALI